MIIYISGKISGLHEDDYYCNFGMAGEALYKLYPKADIESPLGLQPFLGIKSWICYMITDIAALRKCTHIAMQSNWIESRGAIIEYFFAKFIFNHEVIFLQ
jgi:hypothetical protein